MNIKDVISFVGEIYPNLFANVLIDIQDSLNHIFFLGILNPMARLAVVMSGIIFFLKIRVNGQPNFQPIYMLY